MDKCSVEVNGITRTYEKFVVVGFKEDRNAILLATNVSLKGFSERSGVIVASMLIKIANEILNKTINWKEIRADINDDSEAKK